MSKETTEIVYVCSPDRERQLLNSIKTLIRSKTQIDRILIYCVGEVPFHWNEIDARIVIRSVSSLLRGYFYGNKLYLCDSDASRVVYLDTDTFILRSLDEIWIDRSEEFLARPGTKNTDPGWDHKTWSETFESIHSTEIPMFNAGFLIFQNRSHQRIKERWLTYIQKYLSREFPPPYRDQRMPEQWALSLAVAATKITYGFLDRNQHAFGWMSDEPSQAIVYHTGNLNYEKYAERFGCS